MRLILVLIISFFSISLHAQDTIARVKAGDYKFAKGVILVSLVDTVSPGLVQSTFKHLGYEILEQNIYPVSGYINTKIHESKLEELSSHPYIKDITIDNRGFNEKAFLEMVKRQNMTPKDSVRARNMLIDIAENPFKRIRFHYYVTEEMAVTFSQTNSEYNIKINTYSPKSIVLRTETDKETEAMKEVKKLSIVESTAFVMLENEF